jgi:hypothetical protein
MVITRTPDEAEVVHLITPMEEKETVMGKANQIDSRRNRQEISQRPPLLFRNHRSNLPEMDRN